MAKQFGRFDEINIGASLVLSVGDQNVQTNAAVDAHRIARSTFSLGLFSGQAEGYLYSPNAATPSLTSVAGVPPIAIGICTSSAAFNKFLGEDANGYGYCAGDGKIYNNNTVVATIGTCGLNTYIGVVVDPVVGLLSITSNGQPIGSINIPTGQSWYFAATVSGNPGDLAWQVNSGQTPLAYPATGIDGWWQPSTAINPLFLATEPFLTSSTDPIPNLKFNGDIDGTQNPLKVERSVVVWPWGSSMPSMMNSLGTQAQLRVLDPDGLYSTLMTQDVRDQIVNISRQPQDSDATQQEACFSGIIDHVTQDTDQTKTIVITDMKALLQTPLNRALFPPNADPSVAGKPRPLSIGICRNYVPDLYDTTNNNYAAHDSSLSALGTQRAAGKPMVLGTDYSMLPDASGIQLTAASSVKITMESSATGAAYNPLGTDLLSGSGNFLSATPDGNGHPTGWYCYSNGRTTPFWQVNATYGVLTPADENSFQTIVRDPASFTIASGHSYAFQVTISKLPDFGTFTNGSGTFYVNPAVLVAGFASGNTTRGFQILGGEYKHLTATGVYTFQVTNNSGIAQPIGFQYLANELDEVGNQLGISSVKIQQLPNINENVALTGPGLNDMIRAIMITRGPMTDAQYASTDAIAIDTATAYQYGIHHAANEQPQVQADLKILLDCVCGDIYQGSDGKLHVFRLIAPESVSSGSVVGSLGVTDFNGYLQPWPDNAENLTTRINGCKNYSPYSDGDFGSTSLTDCPASVRAKLKQDYQWTAVSGAQLSPKYAPYATNAPPLNSLFDAIAHGQAEISRVNSLYTSPRNFYSGQVFTPIGRRLEIGQVWTVTYPIGNLVAGQQLLVVHVGEQPSLELSDVVFWGL